MNQTVKRIAAYLLIGIVVCVTALSVLAIWNVISLEDVFWKTAKSLFVVFIASIVVVFITSVVIGGDNNSKRTN